MPNLLSSPWEKTDLPIILVVEDSDADFYTFLRAFKQVAAALPAPFALLRFDNGDEVLDYLQREEEYAELADKMPIAMLLDLNLPGTDGREILEIVKQDRNLRHLPVVVMTTSSNPQDSERSDSAGAHNYLVKPTGSADMLAMVENLYIFWFQLASLPHPLSA